MQHPLNAFNRPFFLNSHIHFVMSFERGNERNTKEKHIFKRCPQFF